ncbi:hypothetical protein [Croceimicrobium hydrocarbonivorans]|uniref:Uncharacterized protein n=1 Tax=Croceimicrobium hydrocarbonivorans TaxID=2761580 RepID=A0A7H0VH66_9FLAO|nr:hypothetical protein [Croceimicrobium hydrocarbonivorans]QNR25064.1 hypothetical protein H4K34_04240 [Croceimicrobium hydrocarbonivorans]
MISSKNLFRYSLLMVLAACQNGPQSEEPSISQKTGIAKDSVPEQKELALIIEKPFPNVAVPAKRQAFKAETGATLKFESGTRIIIPANAIQDSNGQLIQGEVEIRLREYKDPIDYFIAGINMAYDSAGTQYSLESAGMCEVRAFQNGKELFLTEGGSMTIELVSTAEGNNYNLYVYDTVSQDWTYLKDKLVLIKPDLGTSSLNKPEPFNNPDNRPIEPPKPKKPTPGNDIIEVVIPESQLLEELKVFKNAKFEVVDLDTAYKPEYAQVEWDWVQLINSPFDGKYFLKFSRFKEERSFLVRPVFTGEDFNEAMQVYEDIQAQKEKARQEWRRKQERAAKIAEKRSKLMRSFRIQNFGVYNCDRILNAPFIRVEPIMINAANSGDTLESGSFVMMQSNSMINYNGFGPVPLPKDQPFFVFSLDENHFYYLKSTGVKELKFQGAKADMILKQYSGGFPESYAEVRQLLEI